MSDERLGCPECGSDSLESGPHEYGTGVVAPDGVEERITENVLRCRECRWYGDEGDLVPIVPEITEEQIEEAYALDLENPFPFEDERHE